MARTTKRRRDAGNEGPRKKMAVASPSASRRITRLMTIDAPRRAVFATAELLENIFIFLPPKSVIGAQRTCRQFRDIVATSAKIREHIFLRRSSTNGPMWHIRSRDYGDSAFIKVVSSTSKLNFANTVAKPVVLHPLLVPGRIIFRTRSGDSVSQAAHPISRSKCAATSTGSWRLMFLTNPPVTKAHISLRWEIPEVVLGEVSRTVQNSSGSTFGDVLDAAMEEKCSAWDGFSLIQDAVWARKLLKMEGKTLKDVITEFENFFGCQASAKPQRLVLDDVVVPSPSEWEQIRGEAEVTKGADA